MSSLDPDRIHWKNFSDTEPDDYDLDFDPVLNEIEDSMAQFTPLDRVLIATPGGGDTDEYPCIPLRDAQVHYEDGRIANMFTVDFKKDALIIQGRIAIESDSDEMKYLKHSNMNGSLIKVAYTAGIIQHGTNLPDNPTVKIWFLTENKWFEIIPHTNYRETYEEMSHVCGMFWANDLFFDAQMEKAMVVHADFARISLQNVIAHYMAKANGSSITYSQFMKLLHNARIWLDKEIKLVAHLKGSPLRVWLRDPEQCLTTPGSEIAATARQEFARDNPPPPEIPEDVSMADASSVEGASAQTSDADDNDDDDNNDDEALSYAVTSGLMYNSPRYPQGIGNSEDIVHVTHVVAMFELQQKGNNPKRVVLAGVSNLIDRVYNTGNARTVMYMMLQQKDAILASMPRELRSSKLYEELDALVMSYAGLVPTSKKKTMGYIAEVQAGRRGLIRRGGSRATGAPVAPARIVQNPAQPAHGFLASVTSLGNGQIRDGGSGEGERSAKRVMRSRP